MCARWSCVEVCPLGHPHIQAADAEVILTNIGLYAIEHTECLYEAS